MPFHLSTITFDDVPMPEHEPARARRSAIVATVCASSAGPRVYAGTIAVPSRSDGAHAEARASGVNASAPLASEDHTSV